MCMVCCGWFASRFHRGSRIWCFGLWVYITPREASTVSRAQQISVASTVVSDVQAHQCLPTKCQFRLACGRNRSLRSCALRRRLSLVVWRPYMQLPSFKYHLDPLSTGSITESESICECCEESRGYIYTGPVYAEVELVDAICPWCIAFLRVPKQRRSAYRLGVGKLRRNAAKEGQPL